MINHMDHCGALLIGGGPAGLAPLVWAARHGHLAELCQNGLVVVDAAEALGAGSLGDHAIGSDTVSDTFLECLDNGQDERLLSLRHHPTADAIRVFKGGAAPLSVVAAFLATLGQAVHASIVAAGGTVLLGYRAMSVRQRQDGGWSAVLLSCAGEQHTIAADQVLLATGAAQRHADLAAISVAGAPLLPEFGATLMLSGEVLGQGGASDIRRRLNGITAPKVVVVGGSHSAVACANYILNYMPDLDLQPGAVTIMHRRPLRVFYPTPAAALAEGYTDFGPEDVCAVSGRLYRLAGFRLDARELVMRALRVGGRPPEPRLQLHRLSDGVNDAESRALLQSADLVVAALGYRPTALPVLRRTGEEWPLWASRSSTAPLVNSSCEILDGNGQAIPGLYGIGLAAGYLPQGAAGGEPSFIGQTNGLWLWQNPIGAMVIKSLLREGNTSVAA